MKSVRLNLLTMWKNYKNTLYVILNLFVSLRTCSVKNLIKSIAHKFQILRLTPQNDIFLKLLLIAVALVLLLATPAQSQFVKTLGGTNLEEWPSVIQAADGGLVVTGWTESFGAGSEDLFLAKFAASGNHLWIRTLGGSGFDRGFSVIEASDGGLVVTGYTESYGAGVSDLLLAKFDSIGNYLWTKTLGGANPDGGGSVIQTSDGAFVVGGTTYSFGAGQSDLLLAKFDSSGNHLWTRTLGGSSWDEAFFSVIEASDGGLIVLGITRSFGAGYYDLLLAKFDSTGNHIWTRTLGGSSDDRGYSVTEASDGGLVVTGHTDGFGAGGDDLLLVKFDSAGNHLWTKTLGGASDDGGMSVIQTSDGAFVVTGTTNSFGAGAWDVFLAKFDSSGNHLWTGALGGASGDGGHSVIQTSDGGLIVTGSTYSFGAGQSDLLLTKFDASGNTCLGEFVTPTTTSPSPTIISPTPTVTTPTPDTSTWEPTITEPTPETTTVCEVPPRIISITDVGNDQGKQVRITWDRCYWDAEDSPYTITEYSLWRRVDGYKGDFSGQDFVIKEVESFDQMLENIANSNYGDRYSITKTGDLWDFIVTVPAMQFAEYSYVAPTLADSTYEDGMYWSVFFVSAHTEDPIVHYDSDPDSGYSLDNIPPLPILNLALLGKDSTHLFLNWTVPGEYPGEEAIFGYDIRYNTVPLDTDPTSWWNNATSCSGEEFFTFSVGKVDSFKAAFDPIGITPYYFAIKGKDLRPNCSLISNVTPKFMCGDVNNDTSVTVSDAVYLISYVLKSGPQPKLYVFVGDVTCDGIVDILDIVYLINYLFRNGPVPCTP